MYLIRQSKSYKRSLKKIKASGNKSILEEIEVVIRQLSEGVRLSEKYKVHQQIGPLKQFRECHVRPDILLIYQIDRSSLILVDIGSHSQLFG